MPHVQQGGVKPNSGGGNSAPGNTNEIPANQTASTPTPLTPAQTVSRKIWGWCANNNIQKGYLPQPGQGTYVKRTLNLDEFNSIDFTQQVNNMPKVWNSSSSGHYTPAIAKYLINTVVNFSVVEMINEDEDCGVTNPGTPNIAVNILTYKGKVGTFIATVLHEIVHAMGGDEFHSHCAEIAAGYISEEEFLSKYLNNPGPALRDDELYFFSGIPDSFKDMYFTDFYHGILKVDKHTFFLALRDFGMPIIKSGTIIKK